MTRAQRRWLIWTSVAAVSTVLTVYFASSETTLMRFALMPATVLYLFLSA